MFVDLGASQCVLTGNKVNLVLVLRVQKCVFFLQFPTLFVVPKLLFNDMHKKGYFACGKILVGL